MTRPDFYEGIHQFLDPDIVAERQEAYMTELETENAEMKVILQEGSGLLMDAQVNVAAVDQDLDERTRFEAALQRILDMPRKVRTGKLCRQIASDALTKGDEA